MEKSIKLYHLKRSHIKFSRAASLVEVLVGCAVGAVLAALLLPAFSKVSEISHRNKCATNLRSIGAGILIVAAENNGKLPALGNNSTEQKPTWGMRVAETLGIDLNRRAQRTVFWCPTDKTDQTDMGQYMHKNHVGHGSYAVNVNLMDWELGTSALGGVARGGGAAGTNSKTVQNNHGCGESQTQ